MYTVVLYVDEQRMFDCVEVLWPSQPNKSHVRDGQFTWPYIYWEGLVL